MKRKEQMNNKEWIANYQFLVDRVKTLESQLAEANKQIEEFDKQHQRLIDSANEVLDSLRKEREIIKKLIEALSNMLNEIDNWEYSKVGLVNYLEKLIVEALNQVQEVIN
jgi:ABC-type transporter Mla subunit MlaD